MPILTFVCVVFFPVSVHAALSCDDVAEVDAREQAGGALLLWTGCEQINARILKDRWDDFPELGQLFFEEFYLVPNHTASVSTSESRDRMIELIGEGETHLQRLVAASWHSQSSEFAELWLKIESNNPVESDLDTALVGGAFYFNQGSRISASDARDEGELLRVIMNSKVPLFEIHRAEMMIRGQLIIGTSEQIIAIFDQHPNFVDSIFLKARYLLSVEDLAGVSKKERTDQALEMLMKAEASGFIQAITDLAYFYDYGEHVTQDMRQATIRYQKLASYGFAYGWAEFGSQLLWGRGIVQDEAKGLYWLNRAAEVDESTALDYLYTYWLGEGSLEKAALIALHNAEIGYVSFDDDGYVAARLLSRELIETNQDQQKFDQFLRFHCERNLMVTSVEGCSVLSDKPRLFSSIVPLVEAVKDPTRLRYADEFSLPTGRYVALIVSNDEYDFWGSLDTPQRDADLVGSILESKYGFEVSHLRNSSRRATLRAIYEMGSDLEFNDHFLLYYAGHGVVDSATDTAYWIPADASRDFRPDWISSSEIMTSLKAIPSKHLLLVADSCYSGKLLRGAAPTEGNPGVAVIQRLFSKKARVAITSGGDEPVQDGSAGGQNSVFANAFASALRGIDGPTPSSTVFDDVLGAVSLDAAQTPQYSDMRELGHDGGDFIFVPGAGQ